MPQNPEIEAGGISLVGPVREDNQDAIRLPADAGQVDRGYGFAIADGMGGYAHGGVASALAIQKFFETFEQDGNNSVQRGMQKGIETANLSVYQTALRLNVGRMGTTLTAGWIRGRTLYLSHVGDSRAYLVRNGHAVCLTNDHTTVGDLVRMKIITPDKVRTHAQRSILTRAIGLGMFVQPDYAAQELREGDCLILCSDGVWSTVEDDDFARLATQLKGAEELSHRLVELALERGSDDNVSSITVLIHSMAGVPEAGPNGLKPGLFSSLRGLWSPHRNGKTA
jgi:serine/threonine protein phosphatase PrpC